MDKTLLSPSLFSAYPRSDSGVGIGRYLDVAPPQPATQASSAAVPVGGAGAPKLDIPTPDCGQLIKGGLTGRSRRIFSRALMGVKKRGRYYFLTLTTTVQNPLMGEHWKNLRKWFKRHMPKTTHFHVITKEGNGVIHMILRLGRGESRLEIKPFREWWKDYTGATQVKILKVTSKEDLARYISDQRYKKKLAGEFAWQDCMVSWGYSAGWLPLHFSKHFGKFWYRSRHAEMGQREMFLHDWLMRCYEDEKEVVNPPIIRSGFDAR